MMLMVHCYECYPNGSTLHTEIIKVNIHQEGAKLSSQPHQILLSSLCPRLEEEEEGLGWSCRSREKDEGSLSFPLRLPHFVNEPRREMALVPSAVELRVENAVVKL